jgi:hypothetical protein
VREGLVAVVSVSATCGIEVSFVPQWYRAFQRADDCPERGLGGLGSCFGGFFPLTFTCFTCLCSGKRA